MAMAAHDDNISNKRRRLFKALSAAPVVATLQPGSAFANASAFQCTKNIRDNLTLHPGPVQPGSSQAGPFLYQYLTHWVFTSYSRVKKSNGSYVSLRGTGISSSQLSAGVTIVQVDPTNSGAHLLKLLPDGHSLAERFAGDPYNDQDVRAFLNGSTLSITNKWGKTCLQASGSVAGFAVIGYAREVGGVQDRDFVIEGIYPEAKVHTARGAHHGDYQGITATCMNSMIGASQYTFTQG